MAKQLTIAINMTINGGTQRRIVRGVVRYSQVHAYWKFVEHEGVPLVRSPKLKHYTEVPASNSLVCDCKSLYYR